MEENKNLDELLKLTRENNNLLKEQNELIKNYISKLDSVSKNLDILLESDKQDFVNNIFANFVGDTLFESLFIKLLKGRNG